MKKLIIITVLLIVSIFGVIQYRKYNVQKNEKASANLVKDMTLISNESCDEFYISDEITNSLYNHITGHNIDGEEDEAVTNISWYDAITFCNELSLRNDLEPAYLLKNDHIYVNSKSNGYRLPTAKEWDCANENNETTILEWTYDYDTENEIYKVIKGGDETNNMIPSETADNVTFKVVKNS